MYLCVCQNPFTLQSCSCQKDTIVLRRVTPLTTSAHQLLEAVLVTIGRKIMCNFGVVYRSHPIECTNKKDKMLGSLLLPCHLYQ